MSIRDQQFTDWLDAAGESWEGYDAGGGEQSPGELLRGVLRDDLAEASTEELEDAVGRMLDSMSAAEGFNFAQALQQIGTTATKALSDPTVNSIMRTAVPLATGALGTFIGGPLGTAAGSGLGNALVSALPPAAGARRSTAPTPPVASAVPRAPGAPSAVTPGATPTGSPAPAAAFPPSPVAGGSAAAAQGLVLTQQPEVLKALLSLALGRAGRPSVNGVPVPQVMTMLSDVFGRAAAHADELMYGSPEVYEAADEVGAPDSHTLYTTLMDANTRELAEATEAGLP